MIFLSMSAFDSKINLIPVIVVSPLLPHCLYYKVIRFVAGLIFARLIWHVGDY